MTSIGKKEDSALYFEIKELVEGIIEPIEAGRQRYNEEKITNHTFQELTEKEIDDGVQRLMDYIKANDAVPLSDKSE